MAQLKSQNLENQTDSLSKNFLFGGISLQRNYDDCDRLPELVRVTNGKVVLERENDSKSVYRKNSQKRRSPSFRTPPCEREMMKNVRSKRSSLYSSTPDLCRSVAASKTGVRDLASGRPSVKQMIHNFEIVRPTVGNQSDDRIPSQVVDLTNECNDKIQPDNSIRPFRSSVRSTCPSNSFDGGFYSDSSSTDGFSARNKSDNRVPSFESSTTLCLLPTTISSNAYHHDNPLYGSLPRIKNINRSSCDTDGAYDLLKAKKYPVQLKRTLSNKCESYSDYVQYSKEKKSKCVETIKYSKMVQKCENITLYKNEANDTEEERTSVSFVPSLDRGRNNVHTSRVLADVTTKPSGTFIARLVEVKDL